MVDLEQGFSVHPKIAADSLAMGDLPLCHVRLMNDANYPWLVLLPRRAGMVEIIDLSEADQITLMRDIAAASRAMKDLTGCHKLNVANLGNQVAQLHIHIIGRNLNDAAWPGPVWGKKAALHYGSEKAGRLIERFKQVLEL